MVIQRRPFVTALAAFYKGIKVGHVGAGLRTYNLHSPFPEGISQSSSNVYSF